MPTTFCIKYVEERNVFYTVLCTVNFINMEIEDIKKLRPTFKFGDMTMTDWFEVSEGKGYCVIKSGLKHADGVTKSPYDYEFFKGGDNATEEVLDHFNNWWNYNGA